MFLGKDDEGHGEIHPYEKTDNRNTVIIIFKIINHRILPK